MACMSGPSTGQHHYAKQACTKAAGFQTSNPADQAESCCVPGAVHDGWIQQLAEPTWQVMCSPSIRLHGQADSVVHTCWPASIRTQQLTDSECYIAYMQCIPGGFDEGGDIPGGSGVKGLYVAMLSSHPIVLGGRHIAQRSSLHSIYSFRGCMHLHCMSSV